MTNCEKAISILELSNDGNSLTPEDLKLVELAANDRLSEKGTERFNQLSEAVTTGSYFTTPHWFHGIENLTRDHDGYVYWKGRQVEHYSFRDSQEERVAAEELAQRCRKLESIGFPVTGRTVLSNACYEAEAQTPWKLALQYFYSFFERNGAIVGIFYRTDCSGDVFCVENVRGKFVLTEFDSAYTAFHAVQDSGAQSMGGQPGYAEVVARLERLGMPASELDAELTRSAKPAKTEHAARKDFH